MPASMQNMQTSRANDTLRLKPGCDLVASTVEELRTVMVAELAKGGAKTLVLDLSTVKLMDSMGITLVLGLFKSCQEAGKGFQVEGVKPELMRVFKLFNLLKFFSVKEAVTHE